MGEKITKEQRRKTMQAIRSQSKLENQVSRELWKKGFRFRKNSKNLLGKPDISIKKYKIVIFIDSCFWHGCELHCRRPKSNQEFWNKKLDRNIERDKEVNFYYQSNNWSLLRVWEHDLKSNFEKKIEEIERFITKAQNFKKNVN